MGWMTGVRHLAGVRNFSLLHSIQTGFGAHSASNLMGTGDSPAVSKRSGCEAYHSLQSSAEVKNGGAIPPLPIHLYGVGLNKLSTGTSRFTYIKNIEE
jgi:hypothetical protein